jgi:hypothetical protein
MELEVLRYSHIPESITTLGLMFYNKSEYIHPKAQEYLPVNMQDKSIHTIKNFLCYTLEPFDHIPAGTYELKLRTFGEHHEKYSLKFPDIHKGMLWVTDVPGFTDILIHIGNTEKDTKGCTLVGATTGKDNHMDYPMITRSTDTYEWIYAYILNYGFNSDNPVSITYKDYYEEI